MRLTTITLAAALLAAPVLAAGSGDHSGHTMPKQEMDHSKMGHGTMDHSKMDHADMEGVHTMAKINSVDGTTVNVTHPPIPALKWPTMTMDLQLLDGAELGTVAAGDSVMLMLEQGADGMYGIKAVMPAE